MSDVHQGNRTKDVNPPINPLGHLVPRPNAVDQNNQPDPHFVFSTDPEKLETESGCYSWSFTFNVSHQGGTTQITVSGQKCIKKGEEYRLNEPHVPWNAAISTSDLTITVPDECSSITRTGPCPCP